MKIWLDDMRHPPEGYVPTKSVLWAARQIRMSRVEHISFDHDLGLPFTGYTLACLIEKWAMLSLIPRMTWAIHSANPVGRGNIVRAMKSAERFWTNGTEKRRAVTIRRGVPHGQE